MQYGLGEDIASFIHRNPEVTDLLISLTGSAAQGDVRRFQPFPLGVEARLRMSPCPVHTHAHTHLHTYSLPLSPGCVCTQMDV